MNCCSACNFDPQYQATSIAYRADRRATHAPNNTLEDVAADGGPSASVQVGVVAAHYPPDNSGTISSIALIEKETGPGGPAKRSVLFSERPILKARNPLLLSSQMNTRELPISGVRPSGEGASRCITSTFKNGLRHFPASQSVLTGTKYTRDSNSKRTPKSRCASRWTLSSSIVSRRCANTSRRPMSSRQDTSPWAASGISHNTCARLDSWRLRPLSRVRVSYGIDSRGFVH